MEHTPQGRAFAGSCARMIVEACAWKNNHTEVCAWILAEAHAKILAEAHAKILA